MWTGGGKSHDLRCVVRQIGTPAHEPHLEIVIVLPQSFITYVICYRAVEPTPY